MLFRSQFRRKVHRLSRPVIDEQRIGGYQKVFALPPSRKRLKTVLHLPNSSGKSRQGLPVRTIHSTASTNKRFNVTGTHGAAVVMMAPAPKGTGIIAGGPMRAVFEVMGITDIVAKSHGSSNPYNMVRATFDALANCTTPAEVAAKRGKSVDDLFA